MCQKFEYRKRDHGRGHGHWGAKEEFKRKLHGMKSFGGTWNHPPVNVREEDDKYELFVYAPGLVKEAFQLAVADGVLIIKTDSKKEEGEDDKNWRRQEFSPGGFKRRFELPEGTDGENIGAKYENGVLLITLPKLEDFHIQRRKVEVD
jgi:HSP20 family protein